LLAVYMDKMDLGIWKILFKTVPDKAESIRPFDPAMSAGEYIDAGVLSLRVREKKAGGRVSPADSDLADPLGAAPQGYLVLVFIIIVKSLGPELFRIARMQHHLPPLEH